MVVDEKRSQFQSREIPEVEFDSDQNNPRLQHWLPPYNSVRMEDAEGINHISAMNKNVPKRVSALSLNNQDTSKDEEIPLRSFNNLQNGDEKNYTVIE